MSLICDSICAILRFQIYHILDISNTKGKYDTSEKTNVSSTSEKINMKLTYKNSWPVNL